MGLIFVLHLSIIRKLCYTGRIKKKRGFMMGKYVFGVDIGGTTIKLGLFTAAGELVEKFAIPTNGGAKLLPDTAKAIIDKLAEFGATIADLLGVGVGVPGPVDEDGVVLVGVNIGWPEPVAVKAELSVLLDGTVVYVTNDANAAAVGELWLGAAKGVNSAIMFTLGTGVGGGVIVNGEVINGANGAGGEIGHIVAVAEGGALCGCGKTGCLETVTSATGIVRMTKELLAVDGGDSSLQSLENLEAKDVFDAAKNGDAFALTIVDKVGYYLGLAAANLAGTTDPEVFIFGGGVSHAGDILLDAIRKHYVKFAFSGVRETPFVIATLGNDAGIMGGAAMVTGGQL